MKKLYIQIIFVIVAGLLSGTVASAQQGGNADRIHAIKVGLLTDAMDLTPAQATKFWPIYNRYEADQKRIWQAKKNITNSNGQTPEELIDERQKLDQASLSIKEKYKKEFLTAISAAQLMKMYQAEGEFRKLLIQKLGKR